ncbi:Modifier of mdg4 [Operophtera brumata]|uniref:Modifier of mdg4 n=1 Tax=Operophtera brumata TaxID=104452 RepID=A0A0L7LNU5_OPEBR|nr:Modifier of mdg4 [Operophtera brumata]
MRRYTYSIKSGIYYCSKIGEGCKARVKLANDEYQLIPTGKDYQLIPSGKGKNIIMYNGFTYSECHGIYYCSSKRKCKCSARLKLTKIGEMITINDKHSHDPPSYLLTAEGKYIKV